jgi:hypothetical protein
MGDDAKLQTPPRTILPRDLLLYIRVAPDERAILTAAAEVSSMPTSSWIRYHALRAAAGVSRPPAPFQAPAARHCSGKLSDLISVRFAAMEHEAILDHARACGLTVSGLVRKLVLGYEPMIRQPHLRSAIAAVYRVGYNLGQLLHLAGAGAPFEPDLARTVGEIRGELHALRDELLRADAAGEPDPGE